MALSGREIATLLGFKNGPMLCLAMLWTAHLDNWQCRMELVGQRVLEAAILLVPSGTLKTQTCTGGRGEVSRCSLSPNRWTGLGVQRLEIGTSRGINSIW